MTPRRRTAARWALHLVAMLMIVASGFIANATSIDSPLSFVGRVLLMAGVMWFAQPVVERLRRFVQSLRGP